MCLDDQILNTYLDGELTEPWKTQVEEHLNYCPSCRKHLEDLKELSSRIKDAQISDEEIAIRQDRVLSMLEKNYLSKKEKKQSFFRKQLKFTMPQFMGVAAAFVIVFIGSWAVFGNRAGSAIPIPDTSSEIEISNITPVKVTQKDLDSYTLEEILKNLDERGYEVDIRIKSILPVSFETEDEIISEDVTE